MRYSRILDIHVRIGTTKCNCNERWCGRLAHVAVEDKHKTRKKVMIQKNKR
jgi:hypothetical protein